MRHAEHCSLATTATTSSTQRTLPSLAAMANARQGCGPGMGVRQPQPGHSCCPSRGVITAPRGCGATTACNREWGMDCVGPSARRLLWKLPVTRRCSELRSMLINTQKGQFKASRQMKWSIVSNARARPAVAGAATSSTCSFPRGAHSSDAPDPCRRTLPSSCTLAAR